MSRRIPKTIIERVAVAICKSRTCEGGSCCQWPGNSGRHDCPVSDGYYDPAAIAAIFAVAADMREAASDVEVVHE